MSDGNSGKPKDYRYEVVATSNYPDYKGEWNIVLDDEAEFLYYTNLANDLIAAVFAKLGQEFSKFRLDQDMERLAKSLEGVQTALSGGILDDHT